MFLKNAGRRSNADDTGLDVLAAGGVDFVPAAVVVDEEAVLGLADVAAVGAVEAEGGLPHDQLALVEFCLDESFLGEQEHYLLEGVILDDFQQEHP